MKASQMRPPPPTLVVVAKNQGLLYPTVSTTATPTSTSWWRPKDYSKSNHFEANAVAVLIILTCALTCALALSVAIRCFLRGSGSASPRQSDQQEVERRKASVDVHTDLNSNSVVLVYSAGGDEVEGECVICLSEFVKGDVIQVLGRCKHGFHVSCIQQWLSSHYSCPTCRCTYLPSTQSLQE